MILETKEEVIAFEFICRAASGLFANAGCNDINEEQTKQFKGCKVFRDNGGEEVADDIKFDFDVLEWLRNRVKVQTEG